MKQIPLNQMKNEKKMINHFEFDICRVNKFTLNRWILEHKVQPKQHVFLILFLFGNSNLDQIPIQWSEWRSEKKWLARKLKIDLSKIVLLWKQTGPGQIRLLNLAMVLVFGVCV